MIACRPQGAVSTKVIRNANIDANHRPPVCDDGPKMSFWLKPVAPFRSVEANLTEGSAFLGHVSGLSGLSGPRFRLSGPVSVRVRTVRAQTIIRTRARTDTIESPQNFDRKRA